MPLADLSFYRVVLFVHIAAAIVAFGVTFAYPIIGAVAQRGDRRALAFWHRTEARLGQVLITPAAVVLLVCGLYLAAQGPYGFSEPWISATLVIWLVLIGMTHAVMRPLEMRLAELAERDVTAAGTGEVTLSADYQAAVSRLVRLGSLLGLLILVAVFLMTTKLGS